MRTKEQDDLISMDMCHVYTICGLAASLKPNRILEIGYGSGRLTHVLLECVAFYKIEATNYTIVDNLVEFGGTVPFLPVVDYAPTLIVSDEGAFVKNCKDQFDLIISDADHQHSHEWFRDVVMNMLAPGGIAFFHDIEAKDLPNLSANIEWMVANDKFHNLSWKVFNKSSLPGERCDRGLLMVMK